MKALLSFVTMLVFFSCSSTKKASVPNNHELCEWNLVSYSTENDFKDLKGSYNLLLSYVQQQGGKARINDHYTIFLDSNVELLLHVQGTPPNLLIHTIRFLEFNNQTPDILSFSCEALCSNQVHLTPDVLRKDIMKAANSILMR